MPARILVERDDATHLWIERVSGGAPEAQSGLYEMMFYSSNGTLYCSECM